MSDREEQLLENKAVLPLGAVVLVALLMVVGLDIRANRMLLVVLGVLVGALVVERRRKTFPAL